MKGLQTGIPLAVLAAVAKAHYIGGETAIDGNHGTDVGNSGSMSFDQTHNTGVDNKGQDDHSVTANWKGTVNPGVGWPLRRKARHWPGGETAIDGAHNVDVGNGYSSSNDQSHNTGISNDNKDDHSATLNGKFGISGWPLRRDYPSETAIDGNHGADVGNSISKTGEKPSWANYVDDDNDGLTAIDGAHNTDVGGSAEFSNDQEHNTGIKNKHDDDHSATFNGKGWFGKRQGKTGIDAPHGTDVGNSKSSNNDQTVNTKIENEHEDDHSVTKNFKAHGHGRPGKRQGKTAIDAPHGTDVGNSQSSNNDQTVNTKIENEHEDDHSVTKNFKAHGHGRPCKRQGKTGIDGNHGTDVGNGFSSSNDQAHNTGIDNDYKDDHSYTENTKAKAHPWWFKRHYPETAIDGAHNTDVGNDFGSSSDQAVNTAIENDWKDDHSVTANGKFGVGPSFFKRSGPLKGIDGAHNVDVGNDFGSSNDQEHNTAIENDSKDDHSVTANTKAQVKPFPFSFAKRQGRTGIDGAHNVDVGNDADFSYDQDMNTEILNDLKDDHSKTSNAKGQIGTPFLPFAKRAGNDRWPEVPHAPVDVAIDAPHGTDIGNQADSSSNQKVNTEVDNKDKDDHSVTLNGKVNGKVKGDNCKRAYRPTSNEESVDSSSPEVSEPSEPQPEPEVEPSHAANTPEAACATETRQVVHTVTQTVYTEPSSAPAVASSSAARTSSAVATPSSEVVEHLIMTSTLMVPASSSFHQIPVYVPEPSSPISSSAVASNSHVPASSPASSSASVPTSVDAYRPGAATSEAIPSPSHGGVSFQGAGVQLAPSAGIMSAVAGVVALLAFVL